MKLIVTDSEELLTVTVDLLTRTASSSTCGGVRVTLMARVCLLG